MKILDRTTIASGGWISLQKIRYLGHDGKIRTWESASRINSQGAVMMIPVTRPGDKLIIIRQFRPPTGRLVYEFPAGLINPGEDPREAAVRELKEALPGVPVSTTAYDHEFGVDTPLDVMDWFTPLTPKFNVEKAAASRKAGHQVWWYICCGPHAPFANMFIECPAIEGRLLMGAQSVRQRPDGFLSYQISIWNSKRCISSGPYTDWDPRSWTRYYGDGSWTCVGPDGTPLPTVRLENFRDGLEDFAYAKLLEAKLAARKDAEDEWSRKARELLAVPQDVMEAMTKYTDDPTEVYRWRDAMADLIESSNR